MNIKLFALVLFAMIATSASAQEEKEKRKGFQKDKLFTGGTVALGFGSGSTSLGIGPYFGYSLNKYLDVAVSLNYSYISQRDVPYYGDKIRQSVIGPGVFARVYPVKFLFAHAQFEENFVKVKYLPYGGSPSSSQSVNAPSFLIGPGFAQGRESDNNTFYYISVLFDVAKNKNSPYVDELGRTTPIFRAGINIGLFGGGESGSRGSRRNRD